MSQPIIRQAAVLGAGVMGAQIAAHLVNAGIPAILFELPAKEGDPNGLVNQAIARLNKLKPAPLGAPYVATAIKAANYQDDLTELAGCDLVIEAIAERLDWKKDLYAKIAPHLHPAAIVASNTSGLSITALAEVLPAEHRPRFLGVHFFNPPRYMHLVELVPHAGTDRGVLDRMETLLTTAIGKGVVRANDTPNFIGNRIGVFSMLATMHHTRAFELGFDVVDALTGPLLGRPKSATYRTADVVGLDTMNHVIGTMREQLAGDPWHRHFAAPEWLAMLIERGALGQKTGAGFFRKKGKVIEVIDPAAGGYRPAEATAAPEVIAILKEKDTAKKFAALRHAEHPQARFLWAMFRDLFHYTAYHLEAIAGSAREVDLAMRWGYGWRHGPLETWQAAGWRPVAEWIGEEIAAGQAMSDAPLPEWVHDGRDGVHDDNGSWSPAAQKMSPRPALPVYRRQLWPALLIGESRTPATTIHEDDAARLWRHDKDVAILTFKTKMHAINDGIVKALNHAVEYAENECAGLVIWQDSEPFCVGADLSGVGRLLAAGNTAEVETLVAAYQQAVMRVKYAKVPVVAAVRGMALGGGCELAMHAARIVAAFESYFGLVEVGAGLLPGGGGLKELALRAARSTLAGDRFPLLQKYFEQVAMGKVAGSALEAREMGYLKDADPIVMNGDEILHVAIAQVRALHEAGYRPPLSRPFPVAGDVGIATLEMMLVNLHEGRFISDHDREIGRRIATVIAGGAIDRDSEVDENWLLNLEREHFIALAALPKTQERIEHLLKTGKPLRN